MDAHQHRELREAPELAQPGNALGKAWEQESLGVYELRSFG